MKEEDPRASSTASQLTEDTPDPTTDLFEGEVKVESESFIVVTQPPTNSTVTDEQEEEGNFF